MTPLVADRALDAAHGGALPNGLLPLLLAIAATAMLAAWRLRIRHSAIGWALRELRRGSAKPTAGAPRLPLHTDTD